MVNERQAVRWGIPSQLIQWLERLRCRGVVQAGPAGPAAAVDPAAASKDGDREPPSSGSGKPRSSGGSSSGEPSHDRWPVHGQAPHDRWRLGEARLEWRVRIEQAPLEWWVILGRREALVGGELAVLRPGHPGRLQVLAPRRGRPDRRQPSRRRAVLVRPGRAGASQPSDSGAGRGRPDEQVRAPRSGQRTVVEGRGLAQQRPGRSRSVPSRGFAQAVGSCPRSDRAVRGAGSSRFGLG